MSRSSIGAVLFTCIAIAHAVAGVAFYIDGDHMAASMQLGGGAIWAVLALLSETIYGR